MKVITFKVDEDLLIMLEAYSMNHRLNRSEAIRKAIEKMVKDEISKEKVPKARVEAVKL
ncbi:MULTISPECIES: CopG family transcriptional regulator [Metallosphaera]|uniref:CopG family transcriptional regulator n=1 Tax=Bacteria TaxID=2 RepID=UPI002989A955|nr:CopG family transcriptional regulator [Metallosphaera sedula]MCP6729962.1 CopG family transcriptional regulator [Metallosphaera sedula]